ncbi:hypothetical protein [Streptomyces sp. NPDC096032]|uniref:hypothetical protein n=1 Tax=Streptomyces sp. NPDC096032 TaxID=3366070 RepID=UPI00382EE772
MWIVAQQELHLTGNDAGRLFASCTKATTMLAALAQLVDGAARINWDALPQ